MLKENTLLDCSFPPDDIKNSKNYLFKIVFKTKNGKLFGFKSSLKMQEVWDCNFSCFKLNDRIWDSQIMNIIFPMEHVNYESSTFIILIEFIYVPPAAYFLLYNILSLINRYIGNTPIKKL